MYQTEKSQIQSEGKLVQVISVLDDFNLTVQ